MSPCVPRRIASGKKPRVLAVRTGYNPAGSTPGMGGTILAAVGMIVFLVPAFIINLILGLVGARILWRARKRSESEQEGQGR